MDNINKEFNNFSKIILNFKIPRWDDLPNIELYMDQVINFIEENTSIFSINSKGKIITPSMVNNYVKLNLIPKPIKKRYNKTHLAYLIAISILKHVFTIQEIKDGISFQAMIHGEKYAYNLFCEEQELALKALAKQMLNENKSSIENLNIGPDNLMIKMTTLAFASKLIGEKTIELQKIFMEKESN